MWTLRGTAAQRGIVFIGPRVEQIEAFALKHTARAIAQRCGVPLLPGTGVLSGSRRGAGAGRRAGLPGDAEEFGGRRRHRHARVPDRSEQLSDAYESVVRLSQNSFRDGSVYLEKFVARAKHVEVQIFGDGKGGVLTLGVRDCSAQRRHQKVIEETPVPGLDAPQRQRDARLCRAARESCATTRRPAQSSSFTMSEPARTTFSKSTRACRWSTASPSRSRASTWSR